MNNPTDIIQAELEELRASQQAEYDKAIESNNSARALYLIGYRHAMERQLLQAKSRQLEKMLAFAKAYKP